MTSRKQTNRFGSRCEGDGSVAGEGRAVGVTKFHSWGKCTMPLMNINSDRMSNASSGLCSVIYAGPLRSLQINYLFLIPPLGESTCGRAVLEVLINWVEPERAPH